MLRWWLNEHEKSLITSYAFSYFALEGLDMKSAIKKAVKVIRPDRVRENGSLKISRSTYREINLRVKGFYK
ncbi:MAG: hypothetical protein KBE27_06720 [Syntrophorhabdaceae bacterium]|nr:hypothetical protein [Syntrophorhabdales bacterium]MBP9561490.1 hypothetical protein [Syntrophorhabdaceae bacterium]